MSQTTWNVNKDALAAYKSSDGSSYGAGVDDHLPVGYVSWLPGYVRSFLGFSYSFSGMVAVTGATLYLKTSTGSHLTHASDPDIYVDRVTASWSEGTAGADEAWSSTNALEWSNMPSVTTAERASWDVGGGSAPADSTFYSVDITGIIQAAKAAGTFYGIRLTSSDEPSSAERVEFYSREAGASNDAYIVVDYTTNTAPNAPTGLSPTADAIQNTLTPSLTGTFSDPDVGDTLTGFQIILYEDNGTTVKWDSGTLTGSGTSFSKTYNGPALTGNTFYKWKARCKDNDGVWGAYSAQQRFKANSVPNAPSISLQESPTTDVKTLTPTFNMTHSDPDTTDSQMLGYRIILELANGTAVWDSGDVAVTATTSKSVVYPGSPALSWQTGYRWRARTKDSNSAWGGYSSNATFTTHTTGIPISLSPTGGVTVGGLTPTLSGSRATSDDLLTSAEIEVYENDGTTLKWSSGSFSSGVTSSAFSKIYSGTALSYSTTYKWRAKVTSSVGGTSAWSALQSFVTPSATTPTQVTPVGSPITDLTPDFTGTWSDTLKGTQVIVYNDAAGTSVKWDQGQTVETTGTSYNVTYAGAALEWNTQYWWKISVQKSSDSVWQPFTGLTSFTTDAAGIPTPSAPPSDAWLGAPDEVDGFENITGVTNGTSSSASQDTAVKQVGRASMKLTITTLSNGSTSDSYRTVALNLSKYGKKTPIKIQIRYSSATNVNYIRLRFTFATASDFDEYDIEPSTINVWETKTLTLDTPVASGGTRNWANVTRIGIRTNASGGSVTTNVNVDNLLFDATAPSFDGTSFGGETITNFRIRVYSDPGGTSLVWDSGDIGGSSTTFTKLYTGSALSKGVVYYWQARYTKSTGPVGNYSALIPFRLNASPSAPSNLEPVSGFTNPDSLIVTFKGTFEDTDKDALGDVPRTFEVEVTRNSDSAIVYSLLKDASLTGGENTVYDGEGGVLKTTGAANPLAYDVLYNHRQRYYDSKGAIGPWTSYVQFNASQSPTTTITSPSDAGTVTSPSFNITWSMSSPGGKAQNSYRVRIVRNSDSLTIYDSGRVYSSATLFAFPSGYLVNSTVYLVQVQLWDTDDLPSAFDSNSVTTSWVAPSAITGFNVTDDVSNASVLATWDQSNLSPSVFDFYRIYRKEASDSTWSTLVDLANIATVSYRDYLAANNVSYDYKITQFKIVPGDVDLESADSDISSTLLDTDSWQIVGADRADAHIFELPVVSAPFLEPVQQEVFEPLGTSRKVVVRGKVLGAEGTLQCKWKDDEVATAKDQVDYIKSNAGPHVLKSPFGDIWEVEFGGPTKDYEGGGHMTVSLTWIEVT